MNGKKIRRKKSEREVSKMFEKERNAGTQKPFQKDADLRLEIREVRGPLPQD